MRHLLVLDDETDICNLISDILEDNGYKVTTVSNASAAIEAVKVNNFTAAIVDVWLEGSMLDGLGVLEYLQKHYPSLPVIMISGHGNIELAVTAIKLGAKDWIEKPFNEERLVLTVNRTVELTKLNQENNHLRKRAAVTLKMVGVSTSIISVKAQIEKLSPTNSRVMITGPSGSGKELAARLIHKKSNKANEPFVVYRAYRSQKTDFLEELVGDEHKSGLIDRVNNGVLYIDEVANLTPKAQLILLKLLQRQPIDGLDAAKLAGKDFRILSSTMWSGEKLLAKEFNENLYQRLKVTVLKMPSLSDHKEDIGLLGEYFTEQIAQLTGIRPRSLSEDAVQCLQLYNWPGNVRELKIIIELMALRADIEGAEELNSTHIPNLLNSEQGSKTGGVELDPDLIGMCLREAREQFEKKYLQMQIERANGSISRTAEKIGMERSALHRKLKTLGVIINRGHEAEEDADLVEA